MSPAPRSGAGLSFLVWYNTLVRISKKSLFYFSFVFAVVAGVLAINAARAFTEPPLLYSHSPPVGILEIGGVDVSQRVPLDGGDDGNSNYNRNGVLYVIGSTSTGAMRVDFEHTLIFRDTDALGGPRMIINDAGNVGIGTMNPQSKLSVGGDGVAGVGVYGSSTIGLYGLSESAYGYGAYVSSANTGVYGKGNFYGIYGNDDTYGSVKGTGVYGAGSSYGVYGRKMVGTNSYGVYCFSVDFWAGGKCGGNRAWDGTSDIRLKENIETITNALHTVTNLRGVTFDWKSGGARDAGFVAQEALPYVPETISYNEERDEYTMAASQLTALLVEAVKELKAEKDGKIAELKRILCDIKPESCE